MGEDCVYLYRYRCTSARSAKHECDNDFVNEPTYALTLDLSQVMYLEVVLVKGDMRAFPRLCYIL
jgi:hypothetical protein